MICAYTYAGQPVGIRASEILAIVPLRREKPQTKNQLEVYWLASVVYGSDPSNVITVDQSPQEACEIWWAALILEQNMRELDLDEEENDDDG